MPKRNYEDSAENFPSDIEKSEESSQFAVVTTSTGKILNVNVFSDGEPSWISLTRDVAFCIGCETMQQ